MSFWILFPVQHLQINVISDADAVTPGAQNSYLAGLVLQYCHLRGTLGGVGSSRKDTLEYGVGFVSISEGLWDTILKAFHGLLTEFVVLFHACVHVFVKALLV